MAGYGYQTESPRMTASEPPSTKTTWPHRCVFSSLASQASSRATTIASAHVSATEDAPKMRVSQAALAAAAIADLDALGHKLGLEPAMSAEQRHALTPGLCVPNAFTEAVAALATRHAELSDGFDPDDAREAIAFAAAYAPVARAAYELGARIESQIAARRGAVGA